MTFHKGGKSKERKRTVFFLFPEHKYARQILENIQHNTGERERNKLHAEFRRKKELENRRIDI
jgi:hypothetical protein